MKKIYIYTGTGAYQARDVEGCLAVFDIDYERICEHDFAKLGPADICVVPGGAIRSYLKAWNEPIREQLKNFVANGGVYIGICAGAYVAGATFDGSEGLSAVPASFVYRKRQGFPVAVTASGDRFEVIDENAPDLSGLSGAVVLEDDAGHPLAVQVKQGRGSYYLFSVHLEGSVYHKKLPHASESAKYFVKFLTSV